MKKAWDGKESYNLDFIIHVLNDLICKDPKAMTKLINHRVKCNDNFIGDPFITVTMDDKIGLLGILNGIFGDSGFKGAPIGLYLDSDGNAVEFYINSTKERNKVIKKYNKKTVLAKVDNAKPKTVKTEWDLFDFNFPKTDKKVK